MNTLTSLLLDGLICLIGLALHIAMKWAEARQLSGQDIGGVAYVKSVPAQTLVAVLASAGVFLVTAAVGWINPGMAFACGYMGNSLAENIANRFSQLPQ